MSVPHSAHGVRGLLRMFGGFAGGGHQSSDSVSVVLSGQLSGALLVPFSLHRWSSEPSLAHCSLARSSSQPPSSCSATSTTSSPSSASQPGSHPPARANHAPDPPSSAPAPLRRSESVGRRPLLRHPTTHAPIIPQRDSDYELEPERGRKRAIDNQYMML